MLSILKTDIKIGSGMTRVGRIFCLVFLAVFFSGLPVSSLLAKPPVLYQGQINTFKLNIRVSPSRTADVVTVVKKGERVDVIKSMGGIGGWLTVVYKGQTGYVRNRPQYILLTPVPRDTTRKPVVTTTSKTGKKKGKPSGGVRAVGEQGQQIREKIRTEQQLVQAFTRKETELIEGLNEIDYSLNRARLKATSLSSEIAGLEERIGQLDQEHQALEQALVTRRDYAGKRMKALYKMSMIGRLDATGMPTSVFDFFTQQNAMKRILGHDLSLVESLTADFKALDELRKRLEADIRSKTDLETQLTEQIRINKQETLKKELILKEIRQKKRLALAVVASLREAEIKLEQRLKNLNQGKGGVLPGKLSFGSYKGRLNPPVRGQIISRFGPRRDRDQKTYTFQKGIDIKVERGEPVKSVFRGQIMFAQWLKGYGNLMIVDHGDHYYTLYAHIEEMFKTKGESVETGEVIATAGDTGSIKGLCLHFEVRHHGKPVNPIQWLKKGA